MDTPHPSLQRLMDEAPFVRLLARTLLAEDADEVVQQTWLRAIQHGGNDVEAPRAWLGRIVRNVATNLRRGRSRQRRHETARGAAGLVPSSAELMQREEQRRMLIAAVDALPEHLRAVVLLRYFEGLLPQLIARRLEVPSTTVRNQLRRALQLLRERLDADHGGQRRAWLLPLVPFAAGTNGTPWAAPAMPASAVSASTVGIGVLAMTMKTKLVAATVVLLAMTGALALWATRDPVPANPEAPSKAAERASVETSNLPRDAVAATSMTNATEREPVSTNVADAPSTGSLELHVRYGDDKAPAAGITMIVGRAGARAPAQCRRQRTDAAGVALLPSLQPGRVAIASDRGSLDKHADIVAGETTVLDYELAIGLQLTGVVVDTTEAPVAGASVEVVSHGGDAETLATSGRDGRFSVRGAPRSMLVGARAEGHGASALKHLQGREGSQVEVRLQLGLPAGSVEGVVVDERGQPISGAVVRIGSGIVRWAGWAPPLPALVHSDAEGRFRALGIPPGLQPVVAAAAGCAPWEGTCEVAAHLVARLRIDLHAGASIRGKVVKANGEPAAGVNADVGQRDDFAHYWTLTTDDGCFEFSDLPAGELLLAAQLDSLGEAEQLVHTKAGTRSECELRLSRGLELRGRVVDDAGAPIAMADVILHSLSAKPGGWVGSAPSDARGYFAVPNCPEGKVLLVSVKARGFEDLERNDATPNAPLELVMRRAISKTVRIKGVVMSPDGKPLPNVMVSAHAAVSTARNLDQLTTADGRFELGPMVPATWTVWVATTAYPDHRSEPRSLLADAVWDLGEIRLPDSCRAIIKVDGDRTDVRFRVVDSADHAWGSVVEENGVLVARRIAPGPHRILVEGKTVAAQSIPFVARAGEPVDVAVKLFPGVRQRFEFVAAALDPSPDVACLHVHRGKELLASWRVRLEADQPATSELCLPPGNFTLTAIAAVDDGLLSESARQLATAAFSIGTTEARPLRLALR